jgi:amidohydrolase
MRIPFLLPGAFLALAGLPFASAQIPVSDLHAQVDKQLPALEKTYLQLHQAPELSRHEEKTSAFLAGELKAMGYDVTDHVGVYEDGSRAFGIMAVLKNGTGPTVLIRTDMDALPVTEATGLPYASKVRTQNADHQDVGVMHACGHDLHMTVFLGAARELAENKSHWHGTVEWLGQPAEELVLGAKAMLADKLYERFTRPDFILAEHDANDYPTGTIGFGPGPLFAAVSTVNLTFHGIGSHGSAPHLGKDPIVMASEFVMMAQTLVSRQTSAQQPAVVTVGTFHAGTKNNIIPDDAVLGMTIRSYDAKVMANLVAGVKRTANAVAEAYGVAPDKMPTIEIPEFADPTVTDPALEARLKPAVVAALGAQNVLPAIPIMGSEDVGYFSDGGKIPFLIYRLGVADPDKFAESQKTGKPLPGLHSALFAPVYQPAIKAGVESMSAMAVALLQ